MRHTKGPWQVSAESAEVHSVTENRIVVSFSRQFTLREQANACLISAAPELLESTKLNYEMLQTLLPIMTTADIRIGSQITTIMKTMQMIIDKAEGV